MTWPFGKRVLTATDLVNQRTAQRMGMKAAQRVHRDKALAHSAVWAALRLRADLISTMPVDVFRYSAGIQFEMPKPAVLVTPGGAGVRMMEWTYSSQVDLDSCGNTFGVIVARDGAGIPSRIDLLNADDVVVRSRDGKLTVHVGPKQYAYREIWHEKQFTVAGCPVGLSPVAYAAKSLLGYLSAQEFACEWFANSAVPAAHLKNTAKTLKGVESAQVKAQFKASLAQGDVFVTGRDWDYSILAAKASESQFLEQQEFSVTDACRFMGVPADMIDANPGGSSITYANVTQRNLQLLIMNLGPAVARREEAWSFGLLPAPRFVKLNTDALLRMDIAGRYASYGVGIDKRFLAPSEARALENKPPFTPEQEAEFARLFASKNPTPTPTPDTGSQS